ncbi:MAG: AraC family transcriptional regulator [Spirochaetaceae bacterium]|nr:MAG: AraC family transcriptional regulator [Spirochaetaceae bacterium]
MLSEMRIISATPAQPLGDHVYWIAYYDSFDANDTGFRMMSEGTVDLLIPLEGQTEITASASKKGLVAVAEPALVGPQQSYRIYDTSRCTRALGIVFASGGAARFLGPQIDALTDSIVPATDILGPDIRALHQRLLEESDPQRLFRIVEAYLRGHFDPDPQHANEIDFAVSAIRRGQTAGISLVDFAEDTIGFSHKHFVELFKRSVGLTPRRYQQLIRFNRMLEGSRLSPGVSWTEIAAAFGYADPSHLAKDFHRFAGMAPGEYQRSVWTHRQVLSDPTSARAEPTVRG